MVIIGHKNSPDTGFKQSDFKQKMGSTKPVPFNRKSIEKKSNIIKTRLFSEKKKSNCSSKKSRRIFANRFCRTSWIK